MTLNTEPTGQPVLQELSDKKLLAKVLSAPISDPPSSESSAVSSTGQPSPLAAAETELLHDGLYGSLRQEQVSLRLAKVKAAMDKPQHSKLSLSQKIKNMFQL